MFRIIFRIKLIINYELLLIQNFKDTSFSDPLITSSVTLNGPGRFEKPNRSKLGHRIIKIKHNIYR